MSGPEAAPAPPDALVIGMQVSMRVDAAQAFIRQFALPLAAGKRGSGGRAHAPDPRGLRRAVVCARAVRAPCRRGPPVRRDHTAAAGGGGPAGGDEGSARADGGPGASHRHGGGGHSGAACNRVYTRNALLPHWVDFNVGFRCVRDVEARCAPAERISLLHKQKRDTRGLIGAMASSQE
jgi:hypothetical protein